MRVIFTQAALKDLDDILNYLQTNFPTLIGPFERRVQAIVTRLSKWPESAPLTKERPDFAPPRWFGTHTEFFIARPTKRSKSSAFAIRHNDHWTIVLNRDGRWFANATPR